MIEATAPQFAGQPLLQTTDLTKSFGGIRAVDHLALSIQRGELRCIIGPNGAGKSTLLALLSGLQRPDSGRILFRGREITRLQPFRRVQEGICQKFQTTRVYRGLTVGEHLLIARSLKASPNGRLDWALQALGLTGEMDRSAGELSHSHQQWLEICLALATAPELLLLDEPTAGMTPEETALTARFVVDLNAQGTTVIVVEHDMAFVRYIARRVTVLHYGRVFADGTLAGIEADQDVRRIYLGEE